MKYHRFATATALAALAWASGAAAQQSAGTAAAAAQDDGALADIVVTASRQAKSVQKTAISVDVVSGEDIVEQQRTSVFDVLKNTVAVQVKASTPNPLIAIRGLGTALPRNVAENAVATTLDGVSTTLSANSLGYYDLDRVEVLRGPQGTLYGRNATAGVLNTFTADPKLGEVSGYASGTYGSYDLIHGEGAINVPLGDMIAFRGAFSAQTLRDLFVNNSRTTRATAGRVKLLFRPLEGISLVVGAELARTLGDGQGVSIPSTQYPANAYTNPNTLVGGITGGDKRIRRYFAKLDAEIGPGVLTLTPGYARQLSDVQTSLTSNNNPTRTQTQPITQKSFEARYSSSPGADLTWNVGYFHYWSQDRGDRTLAGGYKLNGANVLCPDGFTGTGCTTAITAVPNVDTRKTDAVFAQLTVPFGEALRVTAGGRYSWDHKTYTGVYGEVVGTNPVGSPYLATWDDHNFDYRLGIEYDVADRSMLYATLSTGYRPGGFRPNYIGEPARYGRLGVHPSYKKETVTSFEIGSKNRFAEGRIQVNGAAYYYDYKNYIIDNFLGIPGTVNQCAGPPGDVCRAFDFFNAPVEIYGLEVETQFAITPDDILSLNGAYNHSEITGDISYDAGLAGVGDANGRVNLKGRPLTQSPRWNFTASYSHDFHFGVWMLTPRIDWRYSSRQYFRFPYENPRSEGTARNTGDISLTLKRADGGWSINGFVKNMTDKHYVIGFMPQGPGGGGNYNIDSPRTWGIVGTVRF